MKFGKMRIIVPTLMSLIMLHGCAVNKSMVPTGGSRADGTVKMAFEYGAFEVPKVDSQQGQIAAKQRCAAWGYSDAEAFGSSTRACTSSSGGTCNIWRVTTEYQCTGTPTPSK